MATQSGARVVPLLDLRAQHASVRAEVGAAMDRVVDAQAFILGDEVKSFEEAIAERLGAAHAVGVGSGSDALLLSLMAAGVGRGDDVVTTPFTFFATAGAVARLGARVVFVDIDPHTFNLDMRAAVSAMGPRVRAVIPVHLFGRCAPIEPLLAAASASGAYVVEDAAQAIDALRQGRAAGTIGDFGCLSFHPSKNLGGFGDGGMVLVRDGDRAQRVRKLRTHGGLKTHRHDEVGINSRLDSLQAAVLRAKLPHLQAWTDARRAHADRYRRMLADSVPGDAVRPPDDDTDGRHVYNQFTIRCAKRDALCTFLAASGVGSAIYYPSALHLEPCFADLGYGVGAFPEAERASREVLSLPISPTLTEDDQTYVVERIQAFYRSLPTWSPLRERPSKVENS